MAINLNVTNAEEYKTYTQALTAVDLTSAMGYSCMSVITVNAPGTGAFTADSTTDICTKTSHGLYTGAIVRVSTSGALPNPLLAATDYFVIRVTANTFKLAASLPDAQAGTAIDLTTNGTGTQTVTPTAIAGASIKFQGSNDNSNWVDIASSSTNITATVNLLYNQSGVYYRYVRPYFTITTGTVTFSNVWIAKDNGV